MFGIDRPRQGRADRLTEDDRRRFEELFLPHLDAAYNLARWIVQHDQDARDVVQNAYLRTTEVRKSIEPPGGVNLIALLKRFQSTC
jgi:DNA-directed RNA polymerase specialized sigma24 family protein